ncbi:MAG TPA: hypothetical protein VE046_18250 [Steroidobacteraceae bacterium]|nr:hypothetical protein [Steroidobacteraceae bacterium]
MDRQLSTCSVRAAYASVSALLFVSLVACDPAAEAAKQVPVSNINVTVTAAATETACPEDPIKVRFEPVTITAPPPGSLLESKEFIEDLAMEGKPKQAADGSWVCEQTKKTRPVAPGSWNLTVGFDSGNMDCSTEIKAATPHSVAVVEGLGCT